MDTIDLRDFTRDCGARPTRHKGGHAKRLPLADAAMGRTGAAANRPTLTEAAHCTDRESAELESFVETPRFTGALYKASGWTLVGTTKGRGRYDRHTRRDQPKKDIRLRPLRKDWRRTLNR